MATLIFSGTSIAASPVAWVELSPGPPVNYSWAIDELLLFNSSGSLATVQVRRVIGSYSVELFNSTIADGAAAAITDIKLANGQSLEIYTDQDLDYQAYGLVIAPVRKPEYDITYNCFTGYYNGIIGFDVEITGEPLNRLFVVPTFELALDIEITGQGIEGKVYNASLLNIEMSLRITGEGYSRASVSSWVSWSKIGELTFQADFMNDAGTMPMTWTGPIYNILRLDKNAVVYGRGGVSILYPVKEPAPTFGYKEVLNIGLKSKLAVAGDEFIHFFIDARGRLWQMTNEKIEKLGYEEFFSPISNLALFYNPREKKLFISSPYDGYILTQKGLGGGYKNLTGFVDNFETYKLASSNIIGVDPLHFVTDTLDFGFRGLKTIESIQVSADTYQPFLIAIDYKMQKTDRDFSTIGWVPANDEGVAYLRVTALEFRIRVKHPRVGYARVDYLNIQYKRTDSRYMRARMGDTRDDSTASA